MNRSARRAARLRNGKLLALTTTALVLVSGCGFTGVSGLPLPGGADVGDHPYQVKVRFADVLDLVPNAGVRVNDVPVGRVSRIGLAPGSWDAEAVLEVNRDVELPGNAIARLRQSSLLGEKYVELAAPPEPPRGELINGDVIGLDRSGRNPEVEEVLGALSLLLNGGGVAQLQNITRELNAALEGREGDARDLLGNLDQLVAGLDAQRDDITRALDSVNRLAARLDEQRGNIDVALRDLEPGLKVLDDQRTQLVTMLRSLDELSGVATDVVNRSQDDLVHNLRALQPTLLQLQAAGDDLPKSFEILLTYPFTDGAVQGIRGDYTNLYIDADLNLTNILGNIGRSRQPLVQLPGAPPLPLPQPAPDQRPGTSSPGTSTPPEPGAGSGDGGDTGNDGDAGKDGGLLGFLFGGGD
ncbi:MCE family protein [Saccharopolyspora sp. MS10]|uniref:MCE family protein n=1 Tax=Saccharopolyspora sp. MS10 TaxID=3385973 RepID=UPI0039A24FA4